MAGKKYKKNPIPNGKKAPPVKPEVLDEKVKRARKEWDDRGLIPIKADEEVPISENRRPRKWWQFWK